MNSSSKNTHTSASPVQHAMLESLFSASDTLGVVLRTSGTIVDVQFAGQKLPQIHNRLVMKVPADP